MLGRFLNKIFGIRCPICGNKPKGLSMTVQELIDALNKVEDKTKPVALFPDYTIDYVEEFNGDNTVYLF